MNPIPISVVICAHNPELKRLAAVFENLKLQTLPQENWELLVIDNCSEPELAPKVNLSWQKNARVVREEKLGLTWARVRGIQESAGALIVFVDDDNLPAADYLESALKISAERPNAGAWGGNVELQFEIPPAEWTRSYWRMLGSRQVERDCWAGNGDSGCVPCGAGMCVRRSVAAEYARLAATDPKRQALDRRGANLSSSGDTDLALTACDIGFEIGQSAGLKLKHLIPPSRLTREYFLKLQEGMAFSDEVLRIIRHQPANPPPWNFAQSLRLFARFLRMRSFDRKMSLAERAGRFKARRLIRRGGI